MAINRVRENSALSTPHKSKPKFFKKGSTLKTWLKTEISFSPFLPWNYTWKSIAMAELKLIFLACFEQCVTAPPGDWGCTGFWTHPLSWGIVICTEQLWSRVVYNLEFSSIKNTCNFYQQMVKFCDSVKKLIKLLRPNISLLLMVRKTLDIDSVY